MSDEPKQPIPRQQALPMLNPFSLAIIVCPNCGQGVLPTFSRMANGRITGVDFFHVNEDVGCAWKVRGAQEHVRGEMTGLVLGVREGTDAKGQPKYIDEHDKANGKSFDLDELSHPLHQVSVGVLDRNFNPNGPEPPVYRFQSPRAHLGTNAERGAVTQEGQNVGQQPAAPVDPTADTQPIVVDE